LQLCSLHLLECHNYLSAGAIMNDLQVHLLPDLVMAHKSLQVIDCMNRLSVEGDDHIAHLAGAPLRRAAQACPVGGTSRDDLPDDHSLRTRAPDDRVGQQRNTDPGTNDLSKLDQLRNDFVDGVHGHGESDT
jgi:hypothetical protein